MTPSITPKALYQKLKNLEKITLIDIRDRDSFLKHSIYDSVNIPTDKLESKISRLNQNDEIVIISGNGDGASKAQKLLSKHKFVSYILSGGFKSWNNIYDISPVTQTKSTLEIIQVKRLAKGCLSYLIFDPETRKCIIVDPSRHTDIYLQEIKNRELKPKAVVDTHMHSDHFSGGLLLSKKLNIPYLLPENTKAEFKFSKLEAKLSQIFPDKDIQAVKTMGHTSDSIIILLGKSLVLAGDTIYIDAIPPIDVNHEVNDENIEAFYSSITTKILPLKDGVFLLPSHTPLPMVPGPVVGATIRYIKMFCIVKYAKCHEDFKKIQLDFKLKNTKIYEEIKKYNISGKIPTKKADDLEFEAVINAAHPL